MAGSRRCLLLLSMSYQEEEIGFFLSFFLHHVMNSLSLSRFAVGKGDANLLRCRGSLREVVVVGNDCHCTDLFKLSCRSIIRVSECGTANMWLLLVVLDFVGQCCFSPPPSSRPRPPIPLHLLLHLLALYPDNLFLLILLSLSLSLVISLLMIVPAYCLLLSSLSAASVPPSNSSIAFSNHSLIHFLRW